MLNKFIVCSMAILCACIADYSSAETIKPSAIVSIYDGDTFTVNIDGCAPVLCKRLAVRVHGIDAPEMRGKCQQEIEQARLAKQYLVERLRSGKSIELHNVTRDKYYRLGADVIIDSVNVGKEMIAKSLARPYSGGKRAGWCS